MTEIEEVIFMSTEDYDFIVNFDPDRDRTASRADMVDVLYTIQRIVIEGRL